MTRPAERAESRVCPSCGFDLTTPTGDVCPECGGPSDASVHPAALRPPRFPVTAGLLALEHALLGLAFAAFYAIVWHNGASTTYTAPVFWWIVGCALLAVACTLLGGLLRLRWAVRLAAAVQFVIAIGFLLILVSVAVGFGRVIALGVVAFHVWCGVMLLRKQARVSRFGRTPRMDRGATAGTDGAGKDA